MRAPTINLSQRSRDERGSVLIEVLVAMALVALTLTVTTTALITSVAVTGDAATRTDAQHASSEVLAVAKAADWSDLGLDPTAPGWTEVSGSEQTVSTDTAVLTPTRIVVRGGKQFEVDTDITWTTPANASADAWGTKRVVVTVTYKTHNGTTRTVTGSSIRTATPAEAVAPTSVNPE